MELDIKTITDRDLKHLADVIKLEMKRRTHKGEQITSFEQIKELAVQHQGIWDELKR